MSGCDLLFVLRKDKAFKKLLQPPPGHKWILCGNPTVTIALKFWGYQECNALKRASRIFQKMSRIKKLISFDISLDCMQLYC